MIPDERIKVVGVGGKGWGNGRGDLEGVEREKVQVEVHLHFLHFLDLCMLKRPGRQQECLPRQLSAPCVVAVHQIPGIGRSSSPEEEKRRYLGTYLGGYFQGLLPWLPIGPFGIGGPCPASPKTANLLPPAWGIFATTQPSSSCNRVCIDLYLRPHLHRDQLDFHQPGVSQIGDDHPSQHTTPHRLPARSERDNCPDFS